MSRMRKHYKRAVPFRDAKLLLIAVEGTHTERIYFELLSEQYKNSRIKVEVVKRDGTRSSPDHVLDDLISHSDAYNLKMKDEIFLVIDRDKWTSRMLSEVQKSCFERNISLLVSNPNFELWLLLHIEDVSQLSDEEKKKIKENKRVGPQRNARKYLEKTLSDKMDGYNKTGRTSIGKFIPYVETAIENAKKPDPSDPECRRGWPCELGTHVYLVVEKILER